MNRTGLVVALIVAVAVGVPFGIYPRLDLGVSAWFFDQHTREFEFSAQPWVQHSRDAARWLITLIVAPAILALVGKLIAPRRAMLVGARAAVFLVLTLTFGPGVLVNLILKDHWGRSRPLAVVEFGGPDRFVAWWDPHGGCLDNCSFIAGEPSGAFWTLAPASLAPPQWRLAAYGAALAFGAAVGVIRIGGGGHFFTDVVFAGVFVFLLIWTTHGLIYRWPATSAEEGVIDRRLGWIGTAMSGALAALWRRLAGQPKRL